MLIFEASKIIFSISYHFLFRINLNDYGPKMEVTALMGSVMSPPGTVKYYKLT
jgi:hypothetical protein